MIVLLIVTQNEGELLRWNLAHHLEWGIDHIAVADNRSTDCTPDVAREFGDAVSYSVFDDFHERQEVRMRMLDELRARHPVDWVGVSDTDEVFWAPGMTPRELLAEVPPDVVGTNFDAKSFLPTALDSDAEPVFVRRRYRSSSSESPLHTDYTAGKSFYRGSWIHTLTHEHWTPEVPHPQWRHPIPAVHHYMVRDENHFVVKVTRLIAWASPPSGRIARNRWQNTPPELRQLPRWQSRWKKEWWAVYQRGGEAAIRQYYRKVYTLSEKRVPEALAAGWLVEDAEFADWTATRLAGLDDVAKPR